MDTKNQSRPPKNPTPRCGKSRRILVEPRAELPKPDQLDQATLQDRDVGSTDSRSRSELLRALRAGDEQAGAAAAAALGRRRDVKAVAGLIEAARSRRLPETVDALAAIGDPAIPGLLRALARSDPLFAQQALAVWARPARLT